MKTIFMKMLGGRGALFISHYTGKHDVGARQFLINEKYTFPTRHHGDQLGEFILMKDISHEIYPPYLNKMIGIPFFYPLIPSKALTPAS